MKIFQKHHREQEISASATGRFPRMDETRSYGSILRNDRNGVVVGRASEDF